MADLCTIWLDEDDVPLLGARCGEPAACAIRSGCVHEHVTERRACLPCAADEQKAAGLIWCGRCAMTGPEPHDCLPMVVIEWDEGFRDPEPVTLVQQAAPGFQVIEAFSGELIKAERGADLYVAWSHVTGEPRWIGTRAQLLAAGVAEQRLSRADATGSSYFPGEPGLRWGSASLTAEQRGGLPRERLAAYVRAWMDDKLAEAYQMLEPFDWGEEVASGA